MKTEQLLFRLTEGCRSTEGAKIDEVVVDDFLLCCGCHHWSSIHRQVRFSPTLFSRSGPRWRGRLADGEVHPDLRVVYLRSPRGILYEYCS